MDIDQLLRETGDRWRQAQGPAPRYLVDRIVTGQRRPAGRRMRLTTLAAAATAAVVVAILFLVLQADGPATVPEPPASPGPTRSAITPTDLYGTWYASVSIAKARAQHRDLVGAWVLTLNHDGSGRLARLDGTVTVSGRWRLSGPTLSLALPLPGCPAGNGSYVPGRSTLHQGLLEVVPVPGGEPCTARSLVLGGHWQSTPSPG